MHNNSRPPHESYSEPSFYQLCQWFQFLGLHLIWLEVALFISYENLSELRSIIRETLFFYKFCDILYSVLNIYILLSSIYLYVYVYLFIYLFTYYLHRIFKIYPSIHYWNGVIWMKIEKQIVRFTFLVKNAEIYAFFKKKSRFCFLHKNNL